VEKLGLIDFMLGTIKTMYEGAVALCRSMNF